MTHVCTYMVYYSEVYEPLLNYIWESTSVKILGRQLVYNYELPIHWRQL